MIIDLRFFKLRLEIVKSTKVMLIGPDAFTGIFIDRHEAEKQAKRRYGTIDCCRFAPVR